MGRKFLNLKGRRFGRLKVLNFVERKDSHTYWRCKCDCGNEIVTSTSNLRGKSSRSCGCLKREGNNSKHKKSNTRLYNIWCCMKQRCYYSKNPSYKNYGKKGITVCEDWLKSFENFYQWSMKNGYQDDLSIDRIDNDKGYSPQNCKWSTKKEQNNNTSKNRYITFCGETLTLSQWAEKQGINKNTLKNRLNNKWSPWSIEKALTTPARKKVS